MCSCACVSVCNTVYVCLTVSNVQTFPYFQCSSRVHRILWCWRCTTCTWSFHLIVVIRRRDSGHATQPEQLLSLYFIIAQPTEEQIFRDQSISGLHDDRPQWTNKFS